MHGRVRLHGIQRVQEIHRIGRKSRYELRPSVGSIGLAENILGRCQSKCRLFAPSSSSYGKGGSAELGQDIRLITMVVHPSFRTEPLCNMNLLPPTRQQHLECFSPNESTNQISHIAFPDRARKQATPPQKSENTDEATETMTFEMYCKIFNYRKITLVKQKV